MYKTSSVKAPNVGGYFINTPTASTTVVTASSYGLILAGNAGRNYAMFCNTSTAAGDAIFLQLGATTTKPSGIRIPSNNCYEMTPENGNLYIGNIYSIASSTSATVTIVSQEKAN